MSFRIIQAPEINNVNWDDFKLKNKDPSITVNQKAMNAAIQFLNENLQGTWKHLAPCTPMAVRNLITAQLNARANAQELPNEQNIRTRTLFHSSIIGIGWALTLTARIIRVAFRIVFAPISLMVAAYQQHRYAPYMQEEGKHDIILQDLKSIGREIVDLVITLYAGFIGTINSLAPEAIPTDHLRKMYAARIDETTLRNNCFATAKSNYNLQRKQNYSNWKNTKQ